MLPRSVVLGSILLFGLSACGGGGGSDSTDGPLEGREVGRASQLEGTWLATNEGDFIGFEFMDDGKVLATPFTASINGMAVMYDFSILDGGRLSLMAPNGQTNLFNVTVNDDRMQLDGFMILSATNSQQFRRLKRGQTLEQGIDEQVELDTKAYQDRHAALTEFLGRGDLVMTPTTPGPNAPSAKALELVVSRNGRAWHDDAPPHLDQITATIETQGNDASRPAVRISFGPQLDPATQQARGGSQIVFNNTTDEFDNPTLKAQVNFNNQALELEIRRDAGLRSEIIGRFDAEKARVENLRKPLLSALSDFAIIDGMSGAQSANQITQDHLVLVKDQATGKFAGEGTLSYEGRVPQTGPVTADVVVFGEEAMLVIEGNNRQYQMKLASADTGDLSGAWFPSGGQNGWQSTLKITESIDIAERERRAEAQRQALRALSPATQYFGRAEVLAAAWGAPQPFVVMTVTPGVNDSFSVAARFPSIDLDVTMAGTLAETLAGPVLQLRAGDMEIGSEITGILVANNVQRQLQNQVWSLTLAEPGEAGSHLKGGGQNMGPVDLEPMTEAFKRRQIDTVRRTLTAGANFSAWSMIARQAAPMLFQFKLDAATGALTGIVPNRAQELGIFEGQTFAGELSEAEGFASASFVYTIGNRADYTLDWWAFVEPDDDILLIGQLGQISTGRATRAFEMMLVR